MVNTETPQPSLSTVRLVGVAVNAALATKMILALWMGDIGEEAESTCVRMPRWGIARSSSSRGG